MATVAKRETVIVVWRFGHEDPETVQTLTYAGRGVRVYDRDNIDPRAYLGESLPPYFNNIKLAFEYMNKNPHRVVQLDYKEAERNGLA